MSGTIICRTCAHRAHAAGQCSHLVQIAPDVRGLTRCQCRAAAPMAKGIVYISGPMTGHFEHNYAAFHAAAAAWRRAGWKVLNPAENFDGRTDLDYATYIREDIHQMLASTAIAMLPGWEESRGAKLELHMAQALGLALYYADVPGQPFIYCPTVVTAVQR
jgi:hypothetical protein